MQQIVHLGAKTIAQAHQYMLLRIDEKKGLCE